MKAIDVMNHFREIGTWVNWERTVDRFLHGNPEVEVRGIAVAWIASNAALQKAAEKGLNLFISHEPCFYGRSEERPAARELAQKKRAFMDRHGITLLRCHDTWDRMPEIGIPDAWGDFLGFETEPRPVESFYKICLMEETTVEDVARRILEKVKPLGQDCVMVLGDQQKRVSRMAIGTGAISNPVMMFALNPDQPRLHPDCRRYNKHARQRPLGNRPGNPAPHRQSSRSGVPRHDGHGPLLAGEIPRNPGRVPECRLSLQHHRRLAFAASLTTEDDTADADCRVLSHSPETCSNRRKRS